jgi:hypothetical protein
MVRIDGRVPQSILVTIGKNGAMEMDIAESTSGSLDLAGQTSTPVTEYR